MKMGFETILYEAADGVATVTLNRPDVLNAFTGRMRTELADAMMQVERDGTVRAVILTGAGRAFCAGQDLQDIKDAYTGGGAPVFGDMLRQGYNPLILRMRNLEKPIVAAVNGAAAGAGCSLALACDLILASETASFIQVFVRVGLVPDCGSLFFLPRLVGFARAMELCLRGDAVIARDAERMGLVNGVVPPDDLMKTAREWALRLARGPGKAIGLIKRGLNRSIGSDLESMLEVEAQLQEIAGRTQDHREGVLAFLEKRAPKFQGL
jgi:2-(1,2-epoxy-1,2-dihydrophenyl)acetyl-CoA isomerase